MIFSLKVSLSVNYRRTAGTVLISLIVITGNAASVINEQVWKWPQKALLVLLCCVLHSLLCLHDTKVSTHAIVGYY